MELAFHALCIRKEPLLTRFLASELAKDHYFNISRAREDFGYIPEISTEEGFQRMIEYFQQSSHGPQGAHK
jgi:nucleoside-diphosphate-sugar epimerase